MGQEKMQVRKLFSAAFRTESVIFRGRWLTSQKLCERYHLGNALRSRLVTKGCKMEMVPPSGHASGLPVG